MRVKMRSRKVDIKGMTRSSSTLPRRSLPPTNSEKAAMRPPRREAFKRVVKDSLAQYDNVHKGQDSGEDKTDDATCHRFCTRGGL